MLPLQSSPFWLWATPPFQSRSFPCSHTLKLIHQQSYLRIYFDRISPHLLLAFILTQSKIPIVVMEIAPRLCSLLLPFACLVTFSTHNMQGSPLRINQIMSPSFPKYFHLNTLVLTTPYAWNAAPPPPQIAMISFLIFWVFTTFLARPYLITLLKLVIMLPHNTHFLFPLPSLLIHTYHPLAYYVLCFSFSFSFISLMPLVKCNFPKGKAIWLVSSLLYFQCLKKYWAYRRDQ